MSNKRNFKKYVSNLSSSICQDMMATYYNIEGIDVNGVDDAIVKVLQATELAIVNSNLKFDKVCSGYEDARLYSKEKRSFYKSMFRRINKDYVESLKEAVHKFNESIPQEIREANK